MLFVQLSAGQRAELRDVARRAVGRVALRAQMVLLSGRGYAVPQIAAIHECGEDVVRTWLHRYEHEGVAGLADAPRSGRPPTDRLAGEVVDAQAGQPPECSGHAQACWTAGLLSAFLAARFRVVLSRATVRRLLHRAGWRWARPRLAPARRPDAGADAKRAAIAAAAAEAAAGRAALLYLDECDLHLVPVVRAMWMKGPRVRVPTPGQNARRAFFGALDPVSGAWFWADRARKRAVDFLPFLEQLAAAYPSGALYLVLDGAPAHTATRTRAWLAAHPRVRALPLPAYAAHEENPVERVWGSMKDAVAANRLAGSIDELTAAARRFFTDLAPHPAALPVAA